MAGYTIPPALVADVSWQGQSAHAYPPFAAADVSWQPANPVFGPWGWDALAIGAARVGRTAAVPDLCPYQPPFHLAADVSWENATPHPYAPHTAADVAWSCAVWGFFPPGWGSLALGAPSVASEPRIRVDGLEAGVVGIPEVLQPAAVLALIGSDALVFGSATVTVFSPPRTLDLAGHGVAALAFGSSAVHLRQRAVAAQGWVGTAFGTLTAYWWRRSVQPTGLVASAVGAPLVGGRVREVGTFGFRVVRYGVPAVAFWGNPPVATAGLVSMALGEPAVTFYRRELIGFAPPQGAMTQWGEAEVFIRLPKIVRVPAWTSLTFGGHLVAWHTRWVTHRAPFAGGAPGAPGVIHKDRPLFPLGQAALFVGVPWVSRNIVIAAHGFDAARDGRATLAFGNVLQVVGIQDSPLGACWVSRSPRVLLFKARPPSHALGHEARVFNRRQVLVIPDQTEHRTPTAWGAAWVHNRNRVLGVMGLHSLRMPIQFEGVWLAGRALVVATTDSTAWGERTFIAPRIRALHPPGLDSWRPARWGTRVHNAAHALFPTGWDSLTGLRNPVVWDPRQVIKVFRPPTGDVGLAFIADRARTITVPAPYIQQSRLGRPFVGNWEGSLEGGGWDSARLGAVIVEGPYRRGFTPRWLYRDPLGTPAVTNVIRELRVGGRASSLLGNPPWVSHSPRFLAPNGIIHEVFGRSAVRDRRQTVALVGWHSLTCDRWTWVRKALPDPPPNPRVVLDGHPNPGGDLAKQVGVPSLSIIALFPEGWSSLRFGPETNLLARSLWVHSYWPFTAFGTFDSNRTQTVDLTTDHVALPLDPHESGAMTQWGGVPHGHRVSPHTIWARLDTPQQAKDNHPNGRPFEELVPLREEAPTGRFPWFGRPSVINRDRRIVQGHPTWPSTQASKVAPSSRVNMPLVTLRQQTIAPEGFRSVLFDYPVLLPHTKKLRGIGWVAGAFGRATLDAPVIPTTRSLLMSGWSAFASGTTRVELLHRAVLLAGAAHTQWGNNAPLVHFPRRLGGHGLSATQFGTAWVSDRVRVIAVFGTVMTRADWRSFNERMQIRLANPESLDQWRVFPSGLGTFQAGRAEVSSGQRVIQVYQIPPPCLPPYLEIAHG